MKLAIARTQPQYGDQGEVREIERLYLDSIAAARRSIYVENQYFTSHVVAVALARRLAAPDGPEVLVVLPRATGGWLEQNTMDVLRGRLLAKVRKADRHGRLRVCYPTVSGLEIGCLAVHSKLMIVDERLLRLGSANLSNRSMGLDSECDVALEGDSQRVQRAIRFVRDTLLAEHLGTTPERVAEAIETGGSLFRGLDRLCKENPQSERSRSLVALEADVPEHLDRLVPDSAVLDPERPVGVEQLVEQFVGEEVEQRAKSGFRVRVVLTVTFLLGVCAFALTLRFTSLRDWLDPERLASRLDALRLGPLQGLVALPAFTIATGLAIPFGVLVAASAIVFGPWWGAVISLAGGWLASLAGYGTGKAAGRDFVRRIAGARLNRLSLRLAERGVITVIALRLLPVAPFVVVNLVAGASHLRFRDFAVGSALGLIPGVVVMTFLGAGASSLVRDPGSGSAIVFLALSAALGVAALLAARFLRQRSTGRDTPEA